MMKVQSPERIYIIIITIVIVIIIINQGKRDDNNNRHIRAYDVWVLCEIEY